MNILTNHGKPPHLIFYTFLSQQVKLLKKIEELTLYVIELKKENTNLNSRLKQIENKNDGGVK